MCNFLKQLNGTPFQNTHTINWNAYARIFILINFYVTQEYNLSCSSIDIIEIVSQVIEQIRSCKREESHYARAKTKDKQFLDSSLTIAQLWRDFLESKELSLDDDLPISYSTYRKVFRKFRLSFKKPYVDTCGKCDSLLVVIQYSQDEKEIVNARKVKECHIEKADERYDCINFDLEVLPKTKNKRDSPPWVLPPLWK